MTILRQNSTIWSRLLRICAVSLVLGGIVLGWQHVVHADVTVPTPLFLYKFDGGYGDSTSNANDGTAGGTASIATDGTRGQVLSINNSQFSYVSAPVALPSSFTKAAWVYLNTSSDGTYNIISNSSGADSNFLWVSNWTDGGAPSNRSLRAGHFVGAPLTHYVWDADPFPTNTWVHVALTYDTTTNTYVLYKNGVQVGTGTSPADPAASTATLVGSYAAAGNTWTGAIDNAEMWNSALSADQIAAVYAGNLGTGTDGSSGIRPSAITDLVALTRDSSVELAWTTPFDGGDAITDYTVEYKQTTESSYTTYTHTAFTTNTITVTGLTNGVTYDFRVKAVNLKGTASSSNIASATSLAALFDESFDTLSNSSIVGQNGWQSGGSGAWTVGSDGGSGKMVSQTTNSNIFFYSNQIIHGNATITSESLKVDFYAQGVTYNPQVWLRKTAGSGDGGGYLVYYDNGTWGIGSHTASSGDTYTGLATFSTPITLSTNTWYTLEASVVNNASSHPTIRLFISTRGGIPKLIGEYTDTNDRFAAGYFALGAPGFNTTATVSYDNMRVYGYDTQSLAITSPARAVASAPTVATRSITDEGGTFVIPYIQTSTTLSVSAAGATSYVPSTGGVKFVLNEGEATEQIAYDMGSSPYSTSFIGLSKGTYTLDVYAVDQDQVVLSGSGRHDYLGSIGIGDIITAIGDSITAGYPYSSSQTLDWTQAATGTVSLDNRNYPQQDPSNGEYRVGYLRALNNTLSTYYGYPVFIMNEGIGAYKTSDYVTLLSQSQWQNRQSALAPNRWLIHLGANDANASVAASTYKTNIQTIVTTLTSTYGATASQIFLAKPFYIQGNATSQGFESSYGSKLDELVASNLATTGPNFFAYYAPYNGTYYADYIHPNTAGYTAMARLFGISLMRPQTFVVSQSGGVVSLSWADLQTIEPSIAGYTLKYGTSSGTYTTTQNVGNVTSATLSSLTPGQTYYFTISGYDNDANYVSTTQNAAEQSLTVDTSAPSGSVTIAAGSAGTSSTSVTLTLTTNDNVDSSGQIEMQVSNVSNFAGASWEAFASSKNWTLTSGEGTKTVYVRFRDRAGNTSSSVSDTVALDVTAPSTTVTGADVAWHTSAVTIGLSCSDGSGSGCSATYYTTDGTTPTTSSASGSGITFSQNGSFTVKYFSVDAAGNAESVQTLADPIKLDGVAPSLPGNLRNLGSLLSAIQTWLWDAASDAVSGIKEYAWRLTDDVGAVVASGTTTLTSVTQTLASGTWHFYVKSRDNALNESSEASDSRTITVSTPTPSASATPTPTPSSSASSTSSSQCVELAPSVAPYLYGAHAVGYTSLILEFGHATDPSSTYYLDYASNPDEYREYTQVAKDGSVARQTIVVSDLLPHTGYYFRVRAGNQCARSSWSNTLGVTTLGETAAALPAVRAASPKPTTSLVVSTPAPSPSATATAPASSIPLPTSTPTLRSDRLRTVLYAVGGMGLATGLGSLGWSLWKRRVF